MEAKAVSTETRIGQDGGPVSEFSEALGEALRRTRKRRRLSLRDVERQSGERFKEVTLSGYERGIRRVNVETLTALAGFYGVAVETLLPPMGDRPVMVPLDDLQAFVDSLRGVA